MITFTRSQMKGAAISGFILGITFMLLASCAPAQPTQEPLPTYTSYPTYTPFPTATEVLPTNTPFPTYVITIIPLATDTPTTIPQTALPVSMFVKVKGTVTKLLLRQVCFNAYGFIYNLKGLPILSDCIYPHKGEITDRIGYPPGGQIEVLVYGDAEFAAVHGFLSNFGKATIKADGGEEYYVANERGADGELLFVAAWQVKELP